MELGSGGGFLRDVIPQAITSDVVASPYVDTVFSALDMPFPDGLVDAFFAVDVFHHLGDAGRFLVEVERCLRPGGKLLMIEPANTLWSRFVYRWLHHEPFDTKAGWRLPAGGGRLSGANGALPWIVFARDRDRFSRMFPRLRIETFAPHTPFAYLASGGLSAPAFLPGPLYPVIRGVERLLSPFDGLWGMFVTIEIVKAEGAPGSFLATGDRGGI